MRLIALSALAALAALANAECPASLEPRDKSVIHLEKPMTWSQAADACVRIAPGFGMLGRDFLGMSNKDWALCGNLSVPLGLRGTQKGDIEWEDVKDDVNSTYLRLKEPEKRTKTSDSNRVGLLNTVTRKWRLVAGDPSFTCTICQRAWLSWPSRLKMNPPQRPEPLLWAYTFRVVKNESGNSTVDEAVRIVTEHFNQSAIRVEIEIVDGDEASNGTLLRLKSANLTANTSIVSVLNSSFVVEDWQDKDWCPDMSLEGWPAEIVGNMSEKRMADFNLATRRCVAEPRGDDGDFDAAWEDYVAFWIDRGAECKTRPIKNVLRSLERFVARPPLDMSAALLKLVDISAAIPRIEWPLTNPEAFYPQRCSFSRAILSALSLLLTGADEGSEFTGPNCARRTGAFVTDELQAVNGSYAVLLRGAGVCEFVEPHADAFRINRTSSIVLRIPLPLATSGRVALLTFQGRDVERAPLFYPVHDFGVKASAGVVVYAASSTPLSSWRREGKWPVTFEVDNGSPTNSFQRYFSVWNLRDSDEFTRPCPLTKREGSIDTFLCTSFDNDSQNFTTGTFLVFRKIRSQDNELFRFVGRLLEAYTEVALDESALRAAAHLISRLIDVKKFKTHATASGSTRAVAHSNGTLARLLHGVVLSDGPVVTATERHVKVLVSDLNVTAPVIGLSINRMASNSATMQTITATSGNNVSAESEVDVVLIAGYEQFERLEVLAVTNNENIRTVGAFLLSKKLVEVNLALFARSKLDATSEVSVCFEIRLRADRVGIVGRGAINRRLLVATWNNKARDWSVSSCVNLRSMRGSKQVFRCTLHEDKYDAFRGRYLVFEPVGFAEAFGTPLLAVLIAAGVLSGVSLASITGAAAFLPAWRQDVGHKILLQMTLALSFNLALGFTSSLVSVDSASNECVAVGALRHFSYLAMFAWMLVMSGLQLMRLLSVLGARNTPNLLLKVALFAWGLPTLTVVSLVYFNHDIYVSVAADRGFCYPEGVAFVWTVQAPAATILTLNALIFVVIVARLYGFRGWGETEDLRRHLNERSFQMHRLRAVFFTFCLFGITWTFHLLAEQGVFRQKFLYEYLFLITASVHVFSLCCIFVFFEQETRSELLKVLAPCAASVAKSKGAVVERLRAWISPAVTSLMTCLVTFKNKTIVCHARAEDSEHRLGGVYKRRTSDSTSRSWKQR